MASDDERCADCGSTHCSAVWNEAKATIARLTVERDHYRRCNDSEVCVDDGLDRHKWIGCKGHIEAAIQRAGIPLASASGSLDSHMTSARRFIESLRSFSVLPRKMQGDITRDLDSMHDLTNVNKSFGEIVDRYIGILTSGA